MQNEQWKLELGSCHVNQVTIYCLIVALFFHFMNALSKKIQGIWKCCQSTGNLVCSSCNFLILKVKDILKFAVKIVEA